MTAIPRPSIFPLLGLLVSLSGADAVVAQTVDAGTFVILRGEDIVGLEAFELRRVVGAGAGFTLTTSATYPPTQPDHTLRAVLQIGADSSVLSARFDFENTIRQFVLVDVGARRVTVRIGMPNGESTREYPSGARNLLAQDSLFALYALLPGLTPGTVRLLWPRDGRRAGGELVVYGREPTQLGPNQRGLVHMSLGSGPSVRHLWFDDSGRLIKVTIPALGLTAIRRSALP